MPASTVTKSPSALSREISASASRIMAATCPWRRSAMLLYSALLIAMNRLPGRPLPETSPIRKKRRSASSMKKS